MNENEFTINRVIPLLKSLGFKHIRYTHGQDEYGRDIIFYDHDRFGIEKLFCAQVKVGDISGGANKEIEKRTVRQGQDNNRAEKPGHHTDAGEHGSEGQI